MSFAFTTIQGVVYSPSTNDKKVIAYFQPDAKDAPPLIISAYGDLGERLKKLDGFNAVVCGKILHNSETMGGFTIDLAECFVSGEYGESKAIANIVGRYSNRYAEEKKAGNTDLYEFQVSYYIGKEDGKAKYHNWKIAVFGRNIEYFKKLDDGQHIAIPNCALKWGKGKEDKLYLSAIANGFPQFVGGRGND